MVKVEVIVTQLVTLVSYLRKSYETYVTSYVGLKLVGLYEMIIDQIIIKIIDPPHADQMY